MNIQNWKIFDKKGSYINWTPDALINFIFNSSTGKNAQAFMITDPSGNVVDTYITNPGYLYTADTSLSYSYSLEEGTVDLSSSQATIVLNDISIFNPELTVVQSIGDIQVDISTTFTYPSFTYAGAVFLDPVSQGLIETEHLYIFQQIDGSYYRPYDASNYIVIMELLGEDEEIQFFVVDENKTEIEWTNSIAFDVSILVADSPLQVNIGFRSDVEGVFERILRIYHLVGNTLYIMADIVVNAESIAEDERFRTLISNFGLPDPKDIPQVFKQTDINEDFPDWEVLNYKSKHLILEHDKIMPYVGTYKGLINAIKWLGYEDIYVREWFKDVKSNTKLSLVVPFDAKDRMETILMFDLERRQTLRKLNQLSLVYCLTRETGEIDTWGTPITENCYTYNLKEIFIKLLGLKQWLEKYIIGINCRIVDLTGEGIYFERVQNLIYATDNVGYEYKISQPLTPFGVDGNSELIRGDASVRLSFKELTQLTLKDLDQRFIDYAQYAWNPDEPSLYYSIEDPAYLSNPSDFMLVGATFQYPFRHISEISYKLSVEKENAGVVGENLVTNPLFIYENDIRFYNIFDTSSVFFDSSSNLSIYLEEAYLRDPSVDEWTNSIAYTIYQDPSYSGRFFMESSTGAITTFFDYVSFHWDTGSRLQYAYDDNYKVPLLSFRNYYAVDGSGIRVTFGTKEYYLDILDGKIEMFAGITEGSSDNVTMYINWNYDVSLDEQMITTNVVYTSIREKLWQINPTVYYSGDPSYFTGGNVPNIYTIDNSIHTMHVNHIGNYNIELFVWDEFNTLMHATGKTTYPVWIKSPTIYFLVDDSTFMGYDVSKYMSEANVNTLVSQNPRAIYDRYIPLQGLSLEFDAGGNPYVSVPSITYFQDVPEPNSLNKFYNLTERVLTIAGNNITIDPDFQSFANGDNVVLVKFDNGNYSFIDEVSTYITAGSGTSFTLNNIPASFAISPSTGIYLLNSTYRAVTNASNGLTQFSVNIPTYTFREKQMVALRIQNNSNGYSWGATYQVLDVSGTRHTFDAVLPEFFLDSSTYTITAKHAFTTYSDFISTTLSATERDNIFKIYLKDSYCREYYIDDTFVYVNIVFDHDLINSMWYDASLNLVNSNFYYYDKPITIDPSMLVILRAEYDPSTYMLNQKNIWTARYVNNNAVYFRVFNDSVPILFKDNVNFNIAVESYDKYGNLIQTGTR